MWGGYQYTPTDTTNLQLVYSFDEIRENIEFEEKAISHMRSYHYPHDMGTEGMERRAF
jgi:hypothetical protein